MSVRLIALAKTVVAMVAVAPVEVLLACVLPTTLAPLKGSVVCVATVSATTPKTVQLVPLIALLDKAKTLAISIAAVAIHVSRQIALPATIATPLTDAMLIA